MHWALGQRLQLLGTILCSYPQPWLLLGFCNKFRHSWCQHPDRPDPTPCRSRLLAQITALAPFSRTAARQYQAGTSLSPQSLHCHSCTLPCSRSALHPPPPRAPAAWPLPPPLSAGPLFEA